MDDIVVKNFVLCSIAKRVQIVYRKYSECESCEKKVLKRYYFNKDEMLQKR